MTPQDPFEVWKTERRSLRMAPEFVDDVMKKVRALQPEEVLPRRLAARRAFAVLAFAAAASLVLVWQTTLVGTIVLAMPGVAH
jgi:hypothetical protein